MPAYLDSCPSKWELWICTRQELRKRNTTSFFLLSVFSTGQQSRSPRVWGCITMGDCSLHFIGGWGHSGWQVHKRFGECNLPLACFQERCTLDSTFCSESETTRCVWLCWPWTKSLKFKQLKEKYRDLARCWTKEAHYWVFRITEMIKGKTQDNWKGKIDAPQIRRNSLRWLAWPNIRAEQENKGESRAPNSSRIRKIFRAVVEIWEKKELLMRFWQFAFSKCLKCMRPSIILRKQVFRFSVTGHRG